MRLSFSTNAFVRRPVWEAVEKIASAGYEGVEILADAPHLYADAVAAADLEALEAALSRSGLAVSNINANTAMGYYGREFWEPVFEPSLANPDAGARAWRIGYSKKCIDLARILGSPCVSLTSGRMVPGTSPDESLRLFKASLGELLDHAAKRDVRIGIEYEPGLLIERCAELAALIREFDSPYLGANLDLGHSRVLGEDPEETVAALAPKIFHIHIEDIRQGKHYHLIPGEGDIDFAELFGVLERHGYRGFVTVELYTYPHQPEEAAARSLRYLERYVKQPGRNV
jgi:sugar phosphate isomerase/epimerase